MEGEERNVIAFASMPYALNNLHVVKKLEEWMYMSAEGVLGFTNRAVDITFFREREYVETMRFFFSEDVEHHWMKAPYNPNYFEMIAPNGIQVRFIYNPLGGPNRI